LHSRFAASSRVALSSQNKSESNGGLSVFIKVEMGIAATPYSVINLYRRLHHFQKLQRKKPLENKYLHKAVNRLVSKSFLK
jgi:hypothetical protein